MPNSIPPRSSSSSSNSLTSRMLFSSSFSSIMIGEYIGMESCLDLNVNIEGDQHQNHEGYYNQRRSKRDRDQRCMRMKKEFPPPITSLARTKNQPSPMPWELKRYYTSDGRLILREEKVRHQEYFKTHRANGRLILQLVLLDEDEDDVDENEIENKDGNEQCINGNELVSDNGNGNGNENQNEHSHNNDGDKDKKEATDVEKLASSVNESPPSSSSSPVGGGNGKCLIYSDVVSKISPCLFEVPAIRPVH